MKSVFSKGEFVRYLSSEISLVLWVVFSELVALLIWLDLGSSELLESIRRHVGVLVPVVRNADPARSFIGVGAIHHYSVMWLFSPALFAYFSVARCRSWKKPLFVEKGLSQNVSGFVLAVVSAAGIFVLPVWEAGPLKYVVISLFTFAPFSAVLTWVFVAVLFSVASRLFIKSRAE